MAVFTNLDDRVTRELFYQVAYDRKLPLCRAVAQRIALVHVTGREKPFERTVESPPYEIPTSEDPGYCTDVTRQAEALLGLPPSVYFYPGRAHPAFGPVALAFAAGCEDAHTGSATPFDTGGLVHPHRYIKVRLDPDGEAELVAYGESSEIPLNQWRDVFARVLAAYFASEIDYWTGRPLPLDPEGLYELNDDWRAWTFEVRFHEGQSIHDCAAWCADESTMIELLRRHEAQEKTPPGDPPTPWTGSFRARRRSNRRAHPISTNVLSSGYATNAWFKRNPR
jgi:hypothetical protein